MRVLIYGGRDWNDSVATFNFLDECAGDFNLDYDTTVVSGLARGADTLGVEWAVANNLSVDRYPANWNAHGKRAGFIRNQEMLDSGIDLAIQFPGGRGTADMRRRLDKAGVKVIEYEPH